MIKQMNLKRHNRSEEKILEAVNRICKVRNVSYTNLVITENEVTFTTYSNISYENLVNNLVRERYTDSEEFAILRKAINEVTDEFRIYNAFVEECKVKAKQFIEERESALNE